MAYDTDSQSALSAMLDEARRLGADAADASVSARESLSVEVLMGELEGVEREEARSAALRVLIGKRQAAASSNDLSDKGVRALAARVVEMAKAAPEDPYCGLLDERYRAKGPWPDLEQADTARPSAEILRDMALACEEAASAIPEIKLTEGGASCDASHFVYATSDGFEGADSATSYSLGVTPVAERDGKMERDYEYRTLRFLSDLPPAAEIGRIAGQRAVRRLGARKLDSMRAPVIFENRLAGRLLSPFFQGILGSAIARGNSFLKDKRGELIFPEDFEIIEDPLLKRGIASHAFDGEGGRVAQLKLVERGAFSHWLLNAATARQLGLEPNGHATAGHGGPPGVATSNVRIKPGALDLDGMIGAAGEGLLVTDMFSPAFNINTGDWSVGVGGFWFENGAIAYPVSEVTVAGDVLEMYSRLVAGADLDWRGSLEIPSLMVDDLAIGGA